MTHPDDEQRVVPVKHLVWSAGSFVAGLSLAMAIHAQYVVPAIMREVMVEIEKAIDKHEAVPHRVSVSRAEFDMLRESMAAQTEQVLANLRAMSDKIDRLHSN